MKIEDNELKNIYGGSSIKGIGLYFFVTSFIAFISGVLEGYTNSNKCNNI